MLVLWLLGDVVGKHSKMLSYLKYIYVFTHTQMPFTLHKYKQPQVRLINSNARPHTNICLLTIFVENYSAAGLPITFCRNYYMFLVSAANSFHISSNQWHLRANACALKCIWLKDIAICVGEMPSEMWIFGKLRLWLQVHNVNGA